MRGIRLLIDAAPVRPEEGALTPDWDSLSPAAPYRVVNIGNSESVALLDFIEAIEEATGKEAVRHYMPMQTGDVPATFADATQLQELTGYKPQTSYRDGVRAFVAWYREYYQV